MIFRWDPRKHPRDFLGRFRDVINNAHDADRIKSPSGFEAFKYKDDWYVTDQQATGVLPSETQLSRINRNTLPAHWVTARVRYAVGTDPVSMNGGYIPGTDHSKRLQQGSLITTDEHVIDVLDWLEEYNDRTIRDLMQEARDLLDGGQARIRAHDAGIRGFLADGRFKTQHEVGYSSGGVFDPSLRNNVEASLWPDMDDYPIYGYFHDPDTEDVDNGELYGPWVMVLDDKLKDRTTMTVGDSLMDEAPPSYFHELVPETFHGYTNLHTPEMQLWGGLAPDEIDHVILNPAYEGDLEWEEVAETALRLRQHGIATYSAEGHELWPIIAEKLVIEPDSIDIRLEPSVEDLARYDEWGMDTPVPLAPYRRQEIINALAVVAVADPVTFEKLGAVRTVSTSDGSDEAAAEIIHHGTVMTAGSGDEDLGDDPDKALIMINDLSHGDMLNKGDYSQLAEGANILHDNIGGIVYHEMGHVWQDNQSISLMEKATELYNGLEPETITDLISSRAATEPKEMLAEIYAMRIAGLKIPSEFRELEPWLPSN